MSLRTVLLSALGAATVIGGMGAAPADPPTRDGAEPSLRYERLAQVKRDEEDKSDPSVPGGLPGRSDKPDDAMPGARRGFTPPRAKSPAEDKPEVMKDKGKAQDGGKKTQQ